MSYATLPASALLKDSQALLMDGGMFYSTISPVGTGCILEFTKTKIETAIAVGKGGIAFCQGGGSALLTFNTIDFKATTGKKGGGALYFDMSSGNIDLTVSSGSSIASSTATDEYGGIGFLKSTGDVKVIINGPSTSISYSKAKKSGGSFWMEGAGLNSLDIGEVAIATTESSDGEGGLAVMNGQDNYFRMAAKTTIDGCSAA